MNPALELNLLGTGVKAAAMLFLVLGVLLLVLYFLKRVMQPRLQGAGELDIRLLSTRHLSNKERIEVLEVAGEKLVVGVTPGRISFLTKLDPDPPSPGPTAREGSSTERAT